MCSAVKGAAAEAAVLAAFVERGFDVLIPFGAGQPYDLVVDLRGTFIRVQCKTAWPSAGCMLFNSRTTDHGRGQRSYAGLADIFGVYFPPTRTVYLVPISTVPGRQGRLRLEPAQNNQRRRIRLAAELGIDHWTAEALQRVAAA